MVSNLFLILRYCLDCNPLCNTCHGALSSNCGQDCVQGTVWDDPATGGSGCSSECSAGKYEVAGIPLPTCAACSSACEPASAIGQDACFGPGPHECRQCLRFHYNNASFVAGGTTGHDTCVLTCPSGTYPASQGNSSILRCTQCDSSCQFGCTGSGPAACSVQGSGQNPCIAFQISPAFAVSPGSCVATCPDGTWADTNRICQPCDTTVCSRCSGPTASECVAGSCVTTGQNGQCVASCNPASEYQTGIAGQFTCMACDTECATTGPLTGCTGAGPRACRACENHLFDGQCFSSCPGYFENGQCVTQCTSSQAVATFVDANRVCQQCHSQCLSCTGTAQSDCTSCRTFTNSAGLCVSQCSQNERLVGNRCVACHEQCFGTCTGPSPSQCLPMTVTSNRGVTTTRRCRAGIIAGGDGNRTCVATCPENQAYQTSGVTPPLDVTGGFLCAPCETGFRCVNGRSQEPCPFGTVSCNSGSSACVPCPDENGHCVFNFQKGAMDTVQCDSGFSADSATCGCVSLGATTAESGDKSADTNVTILVAVAVGGVVFLVVAAAFVFTNKKAPQEMTPHSIANPAYAVPINSAATHPSAYAPPSPGYGYAPHGAPASQQFMFAQQGGSASDSMM